MVTANVGDFVVLAQRWTAERRAHAGLLLLASRVFPQDRSFVGALVRALDSAARNDRLPVDGAAVSLARG